MVLLSKARVTEVYGSVPPGRRLPKHENEVVANVFRTFFPGISMAAAKELADVFYVRAQDPAVGDASFRDILHQAAGALGLRDLDVVPIYMSVHAGHTVSSFFQTVRDAASAFGPAPRAPRAPAARASRAKKTPAANLADLLAQDLLTSPVPQTTIIDGSEIPVARFRPKQRRRNTPAADLVTPSFALAHQAVEEPPASDSFADLMASLPPVGSGKKGIYMTPEMLQLMLSSMR